MAGGRTVQDPPPTDALSVSAVAGPPSEVDERCRIHRPGPNRPRVDRRSSAVRRPSRGSRRRRARSRRWWPGRSRTAARTPPARSGSWSVSSQPSGRAVAPHRLEVLEAGDRLGGQGLQRPGGDQVAADAVGAEVAGEVARGRLQAGLGHAHPVVRRPRDGRVEGHADDRAARTHQRAAGDRPATSGSTPRPAPPARRPATARRGTCRRAASRGCRRRSSARRRRARRRARARRRRGPSRWSSSVTSSSSTGGSVGSRLAIRRVMPSARPKLEISTVAPCSCATFATAKPIELSIVTPATRIRLPSRMSHAQCPIPSPPSTGMTAPVT